MCTLIPPREWSTIRDKACKRQINTLEKMGRVVTAMKKYIFCISEEKRVNIHEYMWINVKKMCNFWSQNIKTEMECWQQRTMTDPKPAFESLYLKRLNRTTTTPCCTPAPRQVAVCTQIYSHSESRADFCEALQDWVPWRILRSLSLFHLLSEASKLQFILSRMMQLSPGCH